MSLLGVMRTSNPMTHTSSNTKFPLKINPVLLPAIEKEIQRMYDAKIIAPI